MYKLLILFFFVITNARAWQLEVQIGQAKVRDTTADTVILNGTSKDFLTWQWQGSAESVKKSSEQLRKLQFSGGLRYDSDHNWRLENFSLSAGRHGQYLQFYGDALLLSALFNRSISWPEGMALRIQYNSETRAVEMKTLWYGKPVYGKMQATLSVSLLCEILRLVGLNLPDRLVSALRPNVMITKTPQGLRMTGTVDFINGQWHSADKLQEIENINARMKFTIAESLNGWQGDLEGSIEKGQLLFSPLYLEVKQAPIKISTKWQLQGDKLSFSRLKITDTALVLDADMQIDLRKKAFTVVTVRQLSGDINTIYQRYAKPMLKGTLLADAEWKGSGFISGEWRENQGFSHIVGVVNHVTVTDRQGRYQINDVDGQFGSDDERPSMLTIGASRWQKLPIGASQLSFIWRNGIDLQQPWRIPILDGALIIEKFHQLKQRQYRVGMKIEPINLDKLSTVMGWPAFIGKISGISPDMIVNQDGIALSQPILVTIFDGTLQITDLRIQSLLSAIPMLYFSVQVEDLDIEQMTSAFDVARVRGRIRGTINNLVLVNWKVTQFDASLQTPPDNPGTRRISHEAVQYLTKMGGSSAKIAQFIQVLNEFPYEKLGVRASLRGDKLKLDGVASADNGGFYLIKGRSIPRLDIIGYQREVSWQELINRIKSAASSRTPVVE